MQLQLQPDHTLLAQVDTGSNLTLAGLLISSAQPAASPLPSIAGAPLSITWQDLNVVLPVSLFGTLLPDFLSFTAQPDLPPLPHSLTVLTLLDTSVVFQTCNASWETLAQLVSTPAGVR